MLQRVPDFVDCQIGWGDPKYPKGTVQTDSGRYGSPRIQEPKARSLLKRDSRVICILWKRPSFSHKDFLDDQQSQSCNNACDSFVNPKGHTIRRGSRGCAWRGP